MRITGKCPKCNEYLDETVADSDPCPNCGDRGPVDNTDDLHKQCEAPADGAPCAEPAQDGKRYCSFHLAQIQKLADAGRLP